MLEIQDSYFMLNIVSLKESLKLYLTVFFFSHSSIVSEFMKKYGKPEKYKISLAYWER